jgi:(2Fe-2S) ferredoxin
MTGAFFYQKHLFFCVNQKPAGKQCCQNAGASDYFNYAKKKLQQLELLGAGKVRVSSSDCLGRCAAGPVLVIYPEAVWYTYSSFEDIDKIITLHIQSDKLVPELLIEIQA